MADKIKYYSDLNKFFENRLAYEIYKSDKMSIVNLCDYFYVVSTYLTVGNISFGFAMSLEAIKTIISDEQEIDRIILSLEMEQAEKMIVLYSDETFEKAKEIKKQTQLNGPTKDVDLVFEESLRRKNQSF